MSPRVVAVAVAAAVAMSTASRSARADDAPERSRARLGAAAPAKPASTGTPRPEREEARSDDGDARGGPDRGRLADPRLDREPGEPTPADRRPSRLASVGAGTGGDAQKRGALPVLSGGARATLTRLFTSVYAVRACADGGRSTCEQAARALPVVGALVGVATTTGAERALSAVMGAGEVARLGLAAAGAWRLDDEAPAGLRVTLGGPGLLVSGTF